MRKLTKTILFLIIFFLSAKNVSAEIAAGASARLSYNQSTNNSTLNFTIKKVTIKRVLDRYSSPLSEAADAFIQSCKGYDLDCYLLPAISGLESTFGKFILPNSYNPFGWGGGYIMFDKWDDSIDAVGKGLRQNYINKGADSVEKIAPIYSESLTWSPQVRYFMLQFEKEEAKVRLLLDQNTVKL